MSNCITPTTPFWDATQQAWSHAAQFCPPIHHDYCIAGYRVQLQIIGATLAARLAPALAHLACPPTTQPALTVRLWDVSCTPIGLPPPPWQQVDYAARSQVRGYETGPLLAAYQLDSGALSLLDLTQNCALYAVQNAEQLPYYESGMPLRTILHWWLREQGCQLVHAAAVGTERGGVLIVGQGGAGKSTTALSCLLAGMRYVADDYCIVTPTLEPTVASLYNTGKVAADHLRSFPALAPLVSNPEGLSQGEKALLLLQHHFPTQLAACLPLRAILQPQITGQPKTSLQPISPSIALRGLAPSTIFQLSTGGEADFRLLATLVRQVPTYRLALGTTLTQIPKVIQGLLDS
jgi:hypothetical protein